MPLKCRNPEGNTSLNNLKNKLDDGSFHAQEGFLCKSAKAVFPYQILLNPDPRKPGKSTTMIKIVSKISK